MFVKLFPYMAHVHIYWCFWFNCWEFVRECWRRLLSR